MSGKAFSRTYVIIICFFPQTVYHCFHLAFPIVKCSNRQNRRTPAPIVRDDTVRDAVHTMSGSLRTLARRAFAAGARPVKALPTAPYAPIAIRAMATGPAASAVKISDELLEKLGTLTTQALIDGLWVMGWPTSHILGARPLTEGQKKMVGRAITIQFAATRPDIAADKPGGTESPEYEAFELVNGKEVVVMASVGPLESVGGDIKFLRLHQKGVRVCFFYATRVRSASGR